MTERLEVDLTPDQYERVQHAVENGQYDSASAVVNEALTLWEKERERRAIEEARGLISDADKSGYRPWEGADALKSGFREKYAAQLKK